MKRLVLLLFWAVSAFAFGQRKALSSMVSIFVGDSIYEIPPVVTQTEYKPGWKIVDIQTNGKTSRYLWGKHSRQYCDDRQPRFIIDPRQCTLADFVLIKLKEKKEYRKFASHDFYECDFKRFGLDLVAITVLDDDRFDVRFHDPLMPGEYVIVNMKAEAVNEYGDVEVYPFTITK